MNSTPKVSKQPLLLFWGMLVTCALAIGVVYYDLPGPICGLRRWAGIPCPFCGGTRSLAALIQLEWSEAFHLNPMVFLACMSVILWLGLWIADQRLRKQWAISLHQRAGQLPWSRIIFTLALLNWIYLCWMTCFN